MKKIYQEPILFSERIELNISILNDSPQSIGIIEEPITTGGGGN